MLHCLFLYSKPDKKRYTQQLVHATSSVLQKHFLAKVNMQIDKEVCVFLLMLLGNYNNAAGYYRTVLFTEWPISRYVTYVYIFCYFSL